MAINVMIAEQAPEGYPHRAPDDVANLYWDLYTERDQAEHVIG